MLLHAKAQGFGMEVVQANAKYWQVAWTLGVTHEYRDCSNSTKNI